MAQDTKTATVDKPAAADREEFARAHSEQAIKQADRGPTQTQTAEEQQAFEATKDVPADQVDAKIAEAERNLAALRTHRARTVVQEYPKVLYHTDHEHKDNPVAPVTVRSKDEEDEAKGHGWTHANAGEAAKARGSKTPDATEHTREDENVRRDLPAQMALDQDARTGKPPVDSVVDSDAPDPGAPASQAQSQPAQATKPPTNAQVRDAAEKSGTKKDGGR